jgi:hypothetical protein
MTAGGEAIRQCGESLSGLVFSWQRIKIVMVYSAVAVPTENGQPEK